LPEDLPAEVREPKPVAPADAQSAVNAVVTGLFALARQDPKLKVIPAVERELIVRALAETGGNQVQAAKLLGITRATLRKRLEKFGILRKLEVK
jgi:two-component system nitrogen regulation response regulator GlnG